MHRSITLRFLIAVCLISGLKSDGVAMAQAPSAATKASLAVGDPAPQLKVSGWFKGTAVPELEPGKVYVVEFWATWCGPCKKLIPHLTELAKKHAGDVTFVSVSVWERPKEPTDEAIANLVTGFVKSMGDKMDYNVAADGVDQFMAKSWMEAADQKAIPTAFVIGRDGRIAWIGYPADGLEQVLDEVVAGKWDIAREQQRVAKERAAGAESRKLMAEVMAARKAHDYAGTIAALDKAEAVIPGGVAKAPDLISVRLEALIGLNPESAVAYVESITSAGGLVAGKPNFVWSIIRVLGRKNPDPFSKQQWQRIASSCKPMILADKTDVSLVYSYYAEILFHAGETRDAVQYQRKAVERSTQFNEKHKENVQSVDVELLKTQQERLAEMIASAGK